MTFNLSSVPQNPSVYNADFQHLIYFIDESYQNTSTSTMEDWRLVEQTCKGIFELTDEKNLPNEIIAINKLERVALLSLQLHANLRSIAQFQCKPPHLLNFEESEEASSLLISLRTSTRSVKPISLSLPTDSMPIHKAQTWKSTKEQQSDQFRLRKHPLPRRQVRRNNQNKPKLIKRNNEHQCDNCHTTVTPQWRKGPYGPGSLCNACGLKYMDKCK